jgi:hypothetical protein
MCFHKIIEYLSKTDKDAFEIIENLHRYDDRLFDASMNVMNSMSVILDQTKQ